MEFVDIITNTGFDPINRNILDSLNYQELKHFCQTSKEIDDYIKENSLKWKLLEKLQENKYIMKSRGEFYSAADFVDDLDEMDQQPEEDFWGIMNETPIIHLFGSTTFEYFENNGNTAQLTLFLDFIKAYLDDEHTHHWISPIQFAVLAKRIDFVNLMISAPLPLEDLYLYEMGIGGIELMPFAIRNNDIEMVKLLLKFSEEKDVNLDVTCYNREGVSEDILGLATSLGHFKIAQLIQGVLEGKIDRKDLHPVIRRFK